MKKILITLISVLMLLFTSCGKVNDISEIGRNLENTEIVFNAQAVASHSAARANKVQKVIVHEKADMSENFGVYGYVHQNGSQGDADYISGGYLMNNAEYVVATGIPASGTYYWPKADNLSDVKVNFVAIYPYSTTDYSMDANGELVYNLDASTATSNDCVDVLWATRYKISPVNNPLAQANDYNSTVRLDFHHALSLVEFWAKKADSQNIKKVKVTSIEFLDANDDPAEIITDGTLTIEVDEANSTENDYKPVFAYGSTPTTKADFDFAVNSVKDSLLGGNTWNEPADILSSVIIIPQAVPAKVRITFDITIENEVGQSIVYSGRTVTRSIRSANNDENNQAYVDNWTSGKRYIYRFYISADGVTFDVYVDDWTDTNPFDVWDHNELSYVEHFFDKASTMQVQNMVDIMEVNSLMA